MAKHRQYFVPLMVMIPAFWLLFTPGSKAQNVTLTGFIREEVSHEALPYATVYLPASKTGRSANQYGYYTLIVPSGKCDIEVSYVGYQNVKESFELKSDTTIN